MSYSQKPMSYSEPSLDILIDSQAIFEVVLFFLIFNNKIIFPPSVSHDKHYMREQQKLNKNLKLLWRLIEHNKIELYANESAFSECIRYSELDYPKYQIDITETLLEVVKKTPFFSHENHQDIFLETHQLKKKFSDINFEDLRLIVTAKHLGIEKILTHNSEILNLNPNQYDGLIEQNGIKIYDFDSLIKWINEEDKFSDILSDQKGIINIDTPKGVVYQVPVDSTAVDLAYKIHTDIGNTCREAILNGQIVPLDHKLKDGDRVEIITDKNGQPQLGWLSFVRTQTANKIKQWYRDNNRKIGKEKLSEIYSHRFSHNGEILKIVARHFGLKTVEQLDEIIGSGELNIEEVKEVIKGFIKSLDRQADVNRKVEEQQSWPPVLVNYNVNSQPPLESYTYKISRCCTPLPGHQDIIGLFFQTKGEEGLRIHRGDCEAIKKYNLSTSQPVKLQWNCQYCTLVLKVIMRDRPLILNSLLNRLVQKKFIFDVRTVNPIILQRSSLHKMSSAMINVLIYSKYDLEYLICQLQEITDVNSVQIQGVYPGTRKFYER